jgi:competence protein ComEC
MERDGEAGDRTHERDQFAPADGFDFGAEAHTRSDHASSPRPRSPRRGWLFLWQRARTGLSRAAEAELARGTGFVLLPVFFGAGALVYFTLAREPHVFPILAGTVAAALAWLLAARHFVLRLTFAALLAFMLGLGAGKLETWRAGTTMMGSDVTTKVTGRIASVEQRPDGRIRFTIDVVQTARPRLSYPPERIRATARANPDGLRCGDAMTGLVRLMAPSGPVRPHGYDFSFDSYFDRLGAVGFFLRDPVKAAATTPPSLIELLSAWIEQAREDLAAHVRETIGGSEGAVAAALVSGVRGGIPEDVQEALRRAGLAHILSISGLHMVLVALTVMGSIRFAFALFPAIAGRLPVKKYAAALALVTCAFYLLLSGNDVAAQRSFIMLAIMLAALLFDRAAITMRNLAIAALIVLAFSPHEVLGPSFQMSFAATAALIAGFAAWQRWRERKGGVPPGDGRLALLMSKAGLYVGGLAFTSIVAGTATAIFAVWHFQRAAPLGLVANLGAMPIISLAVMPWAVFAIVLMPFGLDAPALYVMGKGLTAVIAIAEWVAAQTPAGGTGAIPASSVLFLSAGLLTLTLFTTRLRLAAIPLFVAGFALIGTRHLPALLVSEDGRLVALRENDMLATNRSRPSSFEMENWLLATAMRDFTKPTEAASIHEARATIEAGQKGFVCAGKTCLARHSSGALVAFTDDPKIAQTLCDDAALIVIDDATAPDTCRHHPAVVISKWALARYGSAAVDFIPVAGKPVPHVTYALQVPWRPWHTQRAWSRAARGLPPYRPRKKKPETAEQANVTGQSRKPSGISASADDITAAAGSMALTLVPKAPLSTGGSGRQGVPGP